MIAINTLIKFTIGFTSLKKEKSDSEDSDGDGDGDGDDDHIEEDLNDENIVIL